MVFPIQESFLIWILRLHQLRNALMHNLGILQDEVWRDI